MCNPLRSGGRGTTKVARCRVARNCRLYGCYTGSNRTMFLSFNPPFGLYKVVQYISIVPWKLVLVFTGLVGVVASTIWFLGASSPLAKLQRVMSERVAQEISAQLREVDFVKPAELEEVSITLAQVAELQRQSDQKTDQALSMLESATEDISAAASASLRDSSAYQQVLRQVSRSYGSELPDNASADTSSSPGLLSLNKATAAQLMDLPGIGEAYAQRILEYRSQKGAFTSIDQLKEVKGIGDALFAKIAPLVSL